MTRTRRRTRTEQSYSTKITSALAREIRFVFEDEFGSTIAVSGESTGSDGYLVKVNIGALTAPIVFSLEIDEMMEAPEGSGRPTPTDDPFEAEDLGVTGEIMFRDNTLARSMGSPWMFNRGQGFIGDFANAVSEVVQKAERQAMTNEEPLSERTVVAKGEDREFLLGDFFAPPGWVTEFAGPSYWWQAVREAYKNNELWQVRSGITSEIPEGRGVMKPNYGAVIDNWKELVLKNEFGLDSVPERGGEEYFPGIESFTDKVREMRSRAAKVIQVAQQEGDEAAARMAGKILGHGGGGAQSNLGRWAEFGVVDAIKGEEPLGGEDLRASVERFIERTSPIVEHSNRGDDMGKRREQQMAESLDEVGRAYALSSRLNELPRSLHEAFMECLDEDKTFRTLTEFETYVDHVFEAFCSEVDVEAAANSGPSSDVVEESRRRSGEGKQEYFDEVRRGLLDESSPVNDRVLQLAGYVD